MFLQKDIFGSMQSKDGFLDENKEGTV